MLDLTMKEKKRRIFSNRELFPCVCVPFFCSLLSVLSMCLFVFCFYLLSDIPVNCVYCVYTISKREIKKKKKKKYLYS